MSETHSSIVYENEILNEFDGIENGFSIVPLLEKSVLAQERDPEQYLALILYFECNYQTTSPIA